MQFTDDNEIVSYVEIITLRLDFANSLKALTSLLCIVLNNAI